MLYKDAILNNLAEKANVAQFVSFSPELQQRYCRIYEYAPNHKFANFEEAIATIFAQSPEASVNLRSFEPNNPKSREFIYGIKDISEIKKAVSRLAETGAYTIVNETIALEDGGVSGVMLADVIEFAPEDTPRCVEKPGTAALPRQLGLEFLKTVYGITPALNYPTNTRVEFSIHPLRRGFLRDHTIIWELEEIDNINSKAQINWPNRFSRFLGDKAYGLLIAHLLGLNVPTTKVISRNIAPFEFGKATHSSEMWIRTCPKVQIPGFFTTQRGWCDPFKLMAKEDPKGENIAAILAQNGINASYSGAAMVTETGEIIIEGSEGFGDEFMIGQKKHHSLPSQIINAVNSVAEQLISLLGPVRMEWVADKEQVWVVQLHCGATKSAGQIIYPGEVAIYHNFDVTQGLEALRDLIKVIDNKQEGIILLGDVGITSHFGDVLRRAQIPSIIAYIATY